MTAIVHIVTVVPAHNEQRRIAAALTSINHARDRLPGGVSSTVVVVADMCRDRTAAITASLLGSGDHLIEVEVRSAGAARAAGAAVGLAAIGHEPAGVWLANTDADTIVPTTWLTDQLEAAAQGFGAVAGIVQLCASECAPVLASEFAGSYTLHLDGTHPHVHGANLGVRADVYHAAGGWSSLTTGEDHELWNKIQAGGARTLATATLVVTTSARRRGRAPQGFARDLARLKRSAA